MSLSTPRHDPLTRTQAERSKVHHETTLLTAPLETASWAAQWMKKRIVHLIVSITIGFTFPWMNPVIASPLDTRPVPIYSGWSDINRSRNSFVVVGDTQKTSHWEFWRERNDKERKLIIEEITRLEPAFVLHPGDLVSRGGSAKHWKEFDDLRKELRRKKIPYFPILGNHEFYGNDREALLHYFHRFPHLVYRRWYSFVWRDIAILMLDSNFSKMTEDQIRQQSQWYLRELERFDRDEKIGFMIGFSHAPPFTNSRVVTPSKDSKTHFADPFLTFQKTRLFFSGHCHSYERFQVGGKFFIVSGGGGGPRHKLFVDPHKRRYPDLYAGSELRFFHFCEIEYQKSFLSFRVIRLEENGTFTIVDPLTILRGKR